MLIPALVNGCILTRSFLHVQEFANVNGKLTKGKGSRKNAKIEGENMIVTNSRSKEANWKSSSPKLSSRAKKVSLQKRQKVEPRVKEEGEISESEPENYEQYKEEKWMEWCADVMEEEEQTLTRLERLQTTSLDLPKEKVESCWILFKFIFYVFHSSKEVVLTCTFFRYLLEFVSTFSSLGERLII